MQGSRQELFSLALFLSPALGGSHGSKIIVSSLTWVPPPRELAPELHLSSSQGFMGFFRLPQRCSHLLGACCSFVITQSCSLVLFLNR